jgi:hypothetical protein
MKRISHLFITTVAGSLLLVGGACSSSGQQGGTGGSGGSNNGPPAGYIPLVSASTGFVQDATTGIIGPWYAYADSIGPNAGPSTGADATNSDCQKKGGFPSSACTVVNNPAAGGAFTPTDAATSKMCTDGVAAQVMQKGSAYDYTDLWGGGIALDFNNPGGDAGVKSTADLSAYKGIYFEISGMTVPGGSMRVNFPFTGEHATDSPYWQGATMMFSPIMASGGKFEVYWSGCPTTSKTDPNCTVGGPYYLGQQNPPTDFTMYPFDPKKVESIQFQVTTNQNATVPYNFCVSNLALIPK